MPTFWVLNLNNSSILKGLSTTINCSDYVTMVSMYSRKTFLKKLYRTLVVNYALYVTRFQFHYNPRATRGWNWSHTDQLYLHSLKRQLSPTNFSQKFLPLSQRANTLLKCRLVFLRKTATKYTTKNYTLSEVKCDKRLIWFIPTNDFLIAGPKNNTEQKPQNVCVILNNLVI